MPRKPTVVRVAQDERRPVSRSKYKAEFVGIAGRLAAQGYTLEQIAYFLCISPATMDRWLATYPTLRKAMEIPKEVADDKVKLALYGNATGRYYEEDEVKIVNGELVKVRLMKYQKPETLAQIFWLKNRRSDLWRTNPEAIEDAAPAPAELEDFDITPENKRDIARRVAFMMLQATKESA